MPLPSDLDPKPFSSSFDQHSLSFDCLHPLLESLKIGPLLVFANCFESHTRAFGIRP